MKHRNYIHFEEIPSAQSCVKFKEFYFDKDVKDWVETKDSNYYRFNIDTINFFILDDNSNFVSINGIIGKFFT